MNFFVHNQENSSSEEEKKSAEVKRIFNSVAHCYDLMNDLMSGGVHRLWKNRFVDLMCPEPGQIILDVAGGTGDIAIRCAKKTKGRAQIIVCDNCQAMLQRGQERTVGKTFLENIKWVIGNAEVLPFANCSIDLLCISFGLRNVTYPEMALSEFMRVLKPGGRFFCLEFSSVITPWLKSIYDLYSFTIIQWLGEYIAKDRNAYRYLAESIRKFPDQKSLAGQMERVGFSDVKWQNLTGGIAVIHSGWKI